MCCQCVADVLLMYCERVANVLRLPLEAEHLSLEASVGEGRRLHLVAVRRRIISQHTMLIISQHTMIIISQHTMIIISQHTMLIIGVNDLSVSLTVIVSLLQQHLSQVTKLTLKQTNTRLN